MSPRSYLRDGHGPRAIDGRERDNPKNGSKRQRDVDESGMTRSKREGSHKASKRDPHHRRQHSLPQQAENCVERPTFELDVIAQPARGITLGMHVETSVLISLRLPAPHMMLDADSIDTSRLFAVVSLVEDNQTGVRTPLEPGALAGQQKLDSVHPLPDDCAAQLAFNQPCRLVLGYFSFPSLLIRQPGTCRVRTTLIEMSRTPDEGGRSILAIDSQTIKVERQPAGSRRRTSGYV